MKWTEVEYFQEKRFLHTTFAYFLPFREVAWQMRGKIIQLMLFCQAEPLLFLLFFL